MRTINRVVLMGHLAADPEIRQTKDGIMVTQFPVATNHTVKEKNGEKAEVADFHRVVTFRKLAEICEKYLAKGMAVYVEGRLINHSFDDKNGNRHFRSEILADKLNILTWKKAKGGQGEIAVEQIPGETEEAMEDELVVA